MEGVQATIERAVEQTAVELPLVGAHEGRMLVLAPPPRETQLQRKLSLR